MKRYIVLLLLPLLAMFLMVVPFAQASTQLLPTAWHLTGTNGDAQAYQGVASNVLSGMTTLTITYDLHGLCALGSDASAIIFDQNGWKYIALSNYGQNCKNGQQTVAIPLSAFKDISTGAALQTSQPVTGSFHTRFWYSGSFTVDIYSAVLSGSTPTPSVTPTPTATPTVTVTPMPTSTVTLTPSPTISVAPTPTVSLTPSPTPTIPPGAPAHTVVVIEENHQLQQLLGTGYFTSLASQGALMVQSFALTHPSQPNYVALFSGSTQGLTDDTCPPPGSPYSANNLAAQLIAKGFTFTGYAENLPTNARTNCTDPLYDNNHTPWVQFSNVPASDSQPFSAFPADYNKLPLVSFVIPNLQDDAHDGTVQKASDWLKTNIEPYQAWAMQNNSLLIVTTDEDDGNGGNLVYTVFAGAMVRTGIYNEQINHYNVLSTIEDMYGLSHLANANGITDIFK